MMPDFSAANFRKTFEFTEKTKGELRQLLRPYYILNLCLAFSFLFVKLTRPFCEILFAPGPVSRNNFLVSSSNIFLWKWNNFEIHHQIFSWIRRHVSWIWERLRSCSSCWWWSWSGPGRLATSPWSTICPVGSCTPSVLISSSSSWLIQGIDQSEFSIVRNWPITSHYSDWVSSMLSCSCSRVFFFLNQHTRDQKILSTSG